MNTRFLSGIATALLLGMPFLSSVGSAVEKETLSGARNYTRVDPTVACGGLISLDAIPELKSRGFAAIINLRGFNERDNNIEAEGVAARAAGLRYIQLPFNAAAPDAPAVVEAFLKAVGDPANHPVYVHSAASHRVGGLWLIKRVIVDHWSTEKALAEAEVIGLSDSSRQFALDYVKTHRQ